MKWDQVGQVGHGISTPLVKCFCLQYILSLLACDKDIGWEVSLSSYESGQNMDRPDEGHCEICRWTTEKAQKGRYSKTCLKRPLKMKPGHIGQSVTCLATNAYMTADPGVGSWIPVRSHTFVEIDHEMISTLILLPPADSFKKGCCQLQAKVCAQITG